MLLNLGPKINRVLIDGELLTTQDFTNNIYGYRYYLTVGGETIPHNDLKSDLLNGSHTLDLGEVNKHRNILGKSIVNLTHYVGNSIQNLTS